LSRSYLIFFCKPLLAGGDLSLQLLETLSHGLELTHVDDHDHAAAVLGDQQGCPVTQTWLTYSATLALNCDKGRTS